MKAKHFYVRKSKTSKLKLRYSSIVADAVFAISLHVGRYVFLWYGKSPIPTPKRVYMDTKYFFKYTLKRKIRMAKKSIKFWWDYKVLVKPVYYEYSSTDCDCVTESGQGVCKNLKEYLEYERMMYEGAEGATYIDIIDEKNYEGNSRHTRDHIMEAFENGNGRSVIV